MEMTLDRLATAGWRDFYDGQLGRHIADELQAAGGVLTREDMADYEPRVTEPYTITYRPATVHGATLPNGGLTALQILNMLECLELPQADLSGYWHLLAEVLKRAWRDRLAYLADPDFAPVPVDRFLSKDYAAGLVEPIRQFLARVDRLVPPAAPEPPHGTRHVSVADAEGNVVAMTISQGGGFGSCFTVPGTGLILGHGMCRLDPRPGRANSIAAGKRPLNNTSPMIVQLPDRDVAIGLPGGRKLLSVMARATQIIVDRELNGYETVVAPRMHLETAEPIQLTRSVPAPIVAELETMGHEVVLLDGIAGAMNCAEFLKGGRSTRAAGEEAAVAARK